LLIEIAQFALGDLAFEYPQLFVASAVIIHIVITISLILARHRLGVLTAAPWLVILGIFIRNIHLWALVSTWFAAL